MKKIIGLTGMKGTGKDFVANTFFFPYEPFAIADSVKIESAKKIKYLDKDDKLILENKNLFKPLLEKEIISQEIDLNFEEFIKKFIKNKNKLNDKDLLKKINLYKNIDSLSTRKELYGYFKVDKEYGYEHVSKIAFEEIKKKKENKIVVTDVRTLLEVTDLLLNDGLLISLYNSRSKDFYNNILFFHFSEFEASEPIKNQYLGFSIDITSRDHNYLKNIFQKIEYSFFQNFKGYSKEFKKFLIEFRKDLLKNNIIDYLEKENTKAFEEKNIKRYKSTKREIEMYKKELLEKIKEEYQKIIIL